MAVETGQRRVYAIWSDAACCSCCTGPVRSELPPIRFKTPNPFVRRVAPAPMLIDTTPIASALKELQPIELQQVRRTGDEPLFPT